MTAPAKRSTKQSVRKSSYFARVKRFRSACKALARSLGLQAKDVQIGLADNIVGTFNVTIPLLLDHECETGRLPDATIEMLHAAKALPCASVARVGHVFNPATGRTVRVLIAEFED